MMSEQSQLPPPFNHQDGEDAHHVVIGRQSHGLSQQRGIHLESKTRQPLAKSPEARVLFRPRESTKQYEVTKLIPPTAELVSWGGGQIAYRLNGELIQANLRELILLHGAQAEVIKSEPSSQSQPEPARAQKTELKQLTLDQPAGEVKLPPKQASTQPQEDIAKMVMKSLRRDQVFQALTGLDV